MPDITKHLEGKKALIDSIISRYLPRSFDKAYLEWAFGKARYSYDSESLNKSLAEPLHDFLGRGGKRWRPALFLLISEMLGSDMEKVKDFAIIPELAHNGSIITDDVEDLGELRRGKPCLHKLFGEDIALNAGNFLYFLPALAFIKKGHAFGDRVLVRAYNAYMQEMVNIHAGQAMDIWWHRGQARGITEEQYLQMCAYKTGTLARLSARLAVILSGGSEELETLLGRLAESLGIAFQIQDDILSASPGEFSKRKGFGDDITEGKRSLLVIHSLRNAPARDRERLLQILGMHTRDARLIKEALEILERSDSIEHARTVAKELVEDAWREAAPRLPDNRAKETLKALMDFATERKI